MDPQKAGFGATSAKALIVGQMGNQRGIPEGRVVITDVPRGSLVVRKVHFEVEN
jgi:hypothetical protein